MARTPKLCRYLHLPIQSGSVTLAGQDITKAKPYERAAAGIGYVPQGREIFARLTVEDNLRNLEGLTRPLGERGETLVGRIDSGTAKLDRLMDETVAGLEATAMLNRRTEPIMSTWDMRVDYGYPVPTLGRDAALKQLIPFLEAQAIYSRGRFGGWKYEASNMDHSVMQGVEWAERMILDQAEKTYHL